MCLSGILDTVWKSFLMPTPSLAKVLVDLTTGDGELSSSGVGIEAEGRLLKHNALKQLLGICSSGRSLLYTINSIMKIEARRDSAKVMLNIDGWTAFVFSDA